MESAPTHFAWENAPSGFAGVIAHPRICQTCVSFFRLSPGNSNGKLQALIVLKAKARMDLSERRERGEHVDSRDVKKHRSDVLRLCTMLPPDARIVVPEAIAVEMEVFLQR